MRARYAVFAIIAGLAAVAHAEDGPELRQRMALLKAEIERIDMEIAAAAPRQEELRAAGATYASRAEANKTVAERVREHGRELAAERQHLTAEHQAATEACRGDVQPHDYAAKAAQCEAARAAYQHRAEDIQRRHKEMTETYARFEAEHATLKAEQEALERRGRDLAAAQEVLYRERDAAVTRFNEARDQLIALQAKPAEGTTAPRQ